MAERLRKNGMTAKYGKCPECGGKIEAMDSKNIVRPAYRWSINCKDDCMSVMAPSVPKLMEGWKELFPNVED